MNTLNQAKKEEGSLPMYSGKSLSENLKRLMDESKITLHQLHSNTNVPLTTLKRIRNNFSANPTINSLLPLAQFFSINLNQLVGLEPLPDDRPVGVYIEKREYWSHVPIITWEQAVDWPNNKVIDHNPSNTISTDIEIGKDTFALVVEEDNWQGFLKGTLLIIDPNKPPAHRSYIVANKTGINRTTLYQLLKHDGERYLKHPYSEYRTVILDEGYFVKGTLIQIRMDTM